MYEYKAHCVDVVDGDTIDVVVDLGFHIQREIRLRLQGVDTHETYGVSHDSEEYRQGKRETELVEEWLGEADGDWPILIRTEKKGKYGRYLAEIERRSDGAVLNEVLLEEFEGVEN
ncbi:YncB-like endonuclease [Halobacterium phage phiH]|uniref:YncB-like endonuclease n=1 Tax=Halobacterium phage phiH TaxID=169684 RepID=A0A3G1ZKR2_BPPHH|nr:endonuclease [Halobacterium phage phiH]AYM00284.1 YncB-like endonuclease [Halobacterium phage phiH]